MAGTCGESGFVAAAAALRETSPRTVRRGPSLIPITLPAVTTWFSSHTGTVSVPSFMSGSSPRLRLVSVVFGAPTATVLLLLTAVGCPAVYTHWWY